MPVDRKVMIFIDGANLIKAAARCNVRLDYSRLIKFLANERVLIRPYFYDALEPTDRKKCGFLERLRFLGFTVITKPLKCDAEGHRFQKGVDVALVTDMLGLAGEKCYDVAIIVSGDNDFASAIEYVKSKGINVEIAAFKESLGRDLKNLADKIIILNNVIDEIKKVL